jgi:type II secretory pathway pseudopilin PulG
LFLDAKNALETAIDSHMSPPASLHPSLTLSKLLRPKATQTTTTPINETFTLGGGTVSMTGSEYYSSPDPETFAPAPNSSFSFPVTMKEDLTATVTNVTVPLQGSPTYTINGKYVYKITVNVTISGTTDSRGTPIDSTLKLSYSISLQMGLAMSVSASTGVGGKFIVTFPFEYSKSGIPLSSFDEVAATADMENDLLSKMQSTTATLKVYDNANTEKHSISLTLAELEAANF